MNIMDKILNKVTMVCSLFCAAVLFVNIADKPIASLETFLKEFLCLVFMYIFFDCLKRYLK